MRSNEFVDNSPDNEVAWLLKKCPGEAKGLTKEQEVMGKFFDAIKVCMGIEYVHIW